MSLREHHTTLPPGLSGSWVLKLQRPQKIQVASEYQLQSTVVPHIAHIWLHQSISNLASPSPLVACWNKIAYSYYSIGFLSRSLTIGLEDGSVRQRCLHADPMFWFDSCYRDKHHDQKQLREPSSLHLIRLGPPLSKEL